MIEQPATPASRPLLPLEYCSIDRAARLLDCEVEDILHWGTVQEIELMLNLDQWAEPVYGEIVLEKHTPLEQFVSVELGSFASFSGIELSSDNPTKTMAWLHGLWNIEPHVIQQRYLGHPLSIIELYEHSFDENCGEDESTTNFQKVGARFTTDDPYPQFWIESYELRKLQNLISGQKTDENQTDTSKPSHGNVTVGDAGRGKILATAIRIQTLYPDICVDNERWAETVADHWREVHPKEEKAPLSMSSDGILKLIRHAKDTGEVYKNPKKPKKGLK
ncbi:hypothetical protein [Aeromonas veronii]|uniref:hypothetical protein n=1 Tax=Aeromonas veronii TaxID=654 RepID=UPI003F79662B